MAALHWNEQQYENMVNEDKPVLIDFWAPWCSYCRRIGPALDRLADQREDLIIAKIDIDEEEQLVRQEQIEVIPTLVLYHRGKSLGSIVAPESKARIEQFIRETLEK